MEDNIDLEFVERNPQFNFKNAFNSTEDDNILYDNESCSHNCQYYEPEDLSNKLQNINSDHFSTISINIRSLPNKFLQLKDFLDSINFHNFKPSIIALQEIWNKPMHDSFDLPEYHPLHFTIRDMNGLNNNSGGGVGIWIHNTLSFEPINYLSVFIPKVFESQLVKIKLKNNKYLIFGNIYRPNTAPFSDIKRANIILADILNKIKSDPNLKNSQDIILSGDLNINILKYESHPDTNVYLDTLLSNGLLPLITLPTRLSQTTATLLDHISTNIIDDNYDTGIIISDLSDHLPVFYIHYLKGKKVLPQPSKYRKVNDTTKLAFKTLLENETWESTTSINNPENAFTNFFQVLDSAYDTSFPEKLNKLSKKYKPMNPWMSPGLLISRKSKGKLLAKKTRNPCLRNKDNFKQFNTIYTKLLRLAKQKYYDDKFKEYKSDSKRTWQTINSILGRVKNKNDIPDKFVSNGKILSGSLVIAEGFNNFFANIGPELAATIPKSKRNFADFLPLRVDENFIFANITPEIITDAIGKLKNTNSTGPDNLSTNVLKYILPAIIKPLCHLFDLSFKTGYIPTILKTAKVIPIFKAGAKDNFNNYRPISLLSPISKVLEKIAALQMMKYINKFQILYHHQYGFRSNHNTTHPLIHFLDKILNSLNNPESKFTISCFIDLKKAFDTCDTNILLAKLAHYGFRGICNTWFKNYLSGRKQYTSLGNSCSSSADMTCGVPQGSILGPILFLLLINDLPNASKELFSILFADDTTLQLSGSNLEELYSNANCELEKAYDWFCANKLTLNISKTKYILFREKKEIVNFNNLNLKIDGKNIDRIGMDCQDKYFKYVGIKLDEFLNWDFHIKHVRNKLSSAVYALSKIKNILPPHIKYTIYNSLFRSHLEYCLINWGKAVLKKDELCIINLQKKAVRYIDNAKQSAHTDNLFKKYNILKLPDLTNFNMAVFMHKIVHKKTPSSFDNFFPKTLNFERSLSFQLQLIRKQKLKSFPSIALPIVWNDLSLDIKRCSSTKLFKTLLTEKKFENYNYKCNKNNCFSCMNV